MRNYPETTVDAATETLAGLSFADPYRWLEEQSDEVCQWQRKQSALAREYLQEWPLIQRLRQSVRRFHFQQQHGEQYRLLPRYAAGLWFRVCTTTESSAARVLVSDEPMGSGRVLFEASVEGLERPPFISWISPSPDGRMLAMGVCDDGSENNTIRLIDVRDATALAGAPMQRIMDNWTGGVQWLPDSSGFLFSAISGAAVDFSQEVYLHQRSPEPGTSLEKIAWVGAKDYRWPIVARDGRYAVAMQGLVEPIPVAVAEIGKTPMQWRPFVTSPLGRLAGHIIGGRYIAVSDFKASRGRVVAISLKSSDPNDVTKWEELIPESEAVIQTVTPVGTVLYVTEFVDTYARVRVVDMNGNESGVVPLPGRGALGTAWWFPMHSTPAKGHPERFLFTFSSFTSSPGIYCHTPGHDSIEVLQDPEVHLDNVVVEDRLAVSADRTRIPYRLVRRGDVGLERPRATLIYAYGGYNFPLVPQFPGAVAAFIEAGGVYVHAHLRGGGEFGRDWGTAGRMQNKQNCYDDLYAIAEDLIGAGVCTPKLLAVTGRSHGGLMAAVAMIQRPDLWAAVIPRVPLLDLVGACRDPYGRMAIASEIADPEDPLAVSRLAALSPYHSIQPDVSYPGVFLEAGDTDPRCPAWHARKFAARLHASASQERPVLLHVWESAGHGLAASRDIAVEQHTEWLAFAMRQLGLDGWHEDGILR